MSLTVAVFLGFFAFLFILFWIAYVRGRRRQLETQDARLMKETQLMADTEERQRQKQYELEMLNRGGLDMMTTYLQRIGSSSQMAAWVNRVLVEVPSSDMATVRLFFHPLDTVVETVRRTTIGGKEILRDRPMPDVRKEYADKVAKGVLRCITEAFTQLPTLQSFVVSGYTPVSGEGQALICAVSARVSRQVFQMVRDLERGQPLEILRNFELRLDCRPESWELSEVTPHDLPLPPPIPSIPDPEPVSPAVSPRPKDEAFAPAGVSGTEQTSFPTTEPGRSVEEAIASRATDPAQQRFEAAVETVLLRGQMRIQRKTAYENGDLRIGATSSQTGTGHFLVRCRRTRDPIDADEIAALADEATRDGADRVLFLTTSTFLLEAVQVATERKVELLDGAKLNLLWKKIQQKRESSPGSAGTQ